MELELLLDLLEKLTLLMSHRLRPKRLRLLGKLESGKRQRSL